MMYYRSQTTNLKASMTLLLISLIMAAHSQQLTLPGTADTIHPGPSIPELTAGEKESLDKFCHCMLPLIIVMKEFESTQDTARFRDQFLDIEKKQTLEGCKKYAKAIDDIASQNIKKEAALLKYTQEKHPDCLPMLLGTRHNTE
jgi:hypothetical protein